jgi:hypothetical protein
VGADVVLGLEEAGAVLRDVSKELSLRGELITSRGAMAADDFRASNSHVVLQSSSGPESDDDQGCHSELHQDAHVSWDVTHLWLDQS